MKIEAAIDGNDVYQIDEEQRRMLIRTLAKAETALDDWINTYAPEFCDAERVKEAQERIGEYGTLAYIALVAQEVRAAKKWLDE